MNLMFSLDSEIWKKWIAAKGGLRRSPTLADDSGYAGSAKPLEVSAVPRSMKNDNFIDKTFTVMADLILKLMPGVSNDQKKAFAYYRDGMSAQSEGEYAEALENYEEALTLEENTDDRSYILYNIGLIHQSNGEIDRALGYYQQALELNPRLSSALNNIAVLLHHRGEEAKEAGDPEQAESLFDEAAQYWIRAVRLAPNNYIEAQNWLKTTGRANLELY